jgi:H+/Cl- antiporter ClcA
MALVLSIIGAAFAAFCLWLTVRIVNRRRPIWPWIVGAILIGISILCILAFGRTIWLLNNPDALRDSIL